MKRLAVVIPWDSPFMFSAPFDGNMNLNRPEGYETRFFRGRGWCPAKRHTDGCTQALMWEADLICILGADQLHPDNTLEKLVAHHEDGRDVVCALVPARTYVEAPGTEPFQRIGWKLNPDLLPVSDANEKFAKEGADDGDFLPVDPSDGDLQQIHMIGTGVLLFSVEAMCLLERPWFEENFDRVNLNRRADMDTRFVWRLQVDAGQRVWCDTTIDVQHATVDLITPQHQEAHRLVSFDGKTSVVEPVGAA